MTGKAGHIDWNKISRDPPRREGPRCPICGEEVLEEGTLMIRNAHQHSVKGPRSFELHCRRADGGHSDRMCDYWIDFDRENWLERVQHVIRKAVYSDEERKQILGIFALWLRSMPEVLGVNYRESDYC
jgi:hypothetical protein